MIEGVVLVALLLCACPGAPLPEGEAFVRSLVSGQRGHEAALSRYAYDMREVKDDLDATGNVTRRRTRDLEVFVVKGRPLRRVMARDDRPLTGAEREQEDRRVRELAEQTASGQAPSQLPGVTLSELLERYRFTARGREELDGRCVLVLDLEARPGDFGLQHDAILKRLAGRLWADEPEQAVAKLQVDNTAPIRVALGLAASVSQLSLRAAFTRLEKGVWLPRSVETLAVGRKLLLSEFRLRRTLTYSRYRRIEVEVGDEPRKGDAPEP